MSNNLPISDRTVFLDVNGVRAARGISAQKVNALVESGELLWVFNVGRIRDDKHIRALRFWLPEILDARTVANLELDFVISKILPPSRRSFNGSEICQWFLISRPHVKRIGWETRGVVKNHLLQVQRELLVNYLRKRWIGRGNS